MSPEFTLILNLIFWFCAFSIMFRLAFAFFYRKEIKSEQEFAILKRKYDLMIMKEKLGTTA
jgi:hypothetical protein